jgi:hypothetical protein
MSTRSNIPERGGYLTIELARNYETMSASATSIRVVSRTNDILLAVFVLAFYDTLNLLPYNSDSPAQ